MRRWTRDTVRQLYNHALGKFNDIPEDEGTLRQRVWMIRDTVPDLKEWWSDLNNVYSTVLQKAVERIRDNINKAEVGWRDFITILEHHGEKNACHVVQVPPEGTSKECARCGVESDKPLWVRTHSCPSCGFELDRNWNASLNVHSRGLDKLGVVHSEATPVETATAVDVLEVSASCVVETGSPCLKEPPKAASRQG